MFQVPVHAVEPEKYVICAPTALTVSKNNIAFIAKQTYAMNILRKLQSAIIVIKNKNYT